MSYATERTRPGREPCRILELYVPQCQLRYGTTNSAGTCPAVLGTDSADKCFNTLATCAVPDSYTPADTVFRWSTAQQGIPPSLRVRPTIVNVDAAPRRLAPSKGLGEGAEARVTVLDHPWGDVWEDFYRTERSYTPAEQGTYWGKWLARNPYYRGIRMRLLDGYISPGGFSLDDFSAREYILDAITGPDSHDRVTIVGTDVFKLLEKDRSVVPAPNTGVLAAAIDEAATSFTLSPSGIGDAEYPAAFRCVIGNEGFDVTRSGDACTITTRGLYRGLDGHEADDTVQEVRRFSAKRVDEIAAAIITEAQPDLSAYIPTADWATEANDYLPRLYSGEITEPTGVNKLLAELMDSVPVVFFPSEKERRIEMRAIKPPPVTRPTFTDAGHFLAGTLQKQERPKDRVDSVLVHFGQLDPTGDREKPSNYSQSVYLISATNYDSRQLREVFSRWIPRQAKAHAEDLANGYIARYRDTPVTLKFSLDAKHGDNWTADVFLADTRKLQNAFGANAPRNFQIIEAFEKDAGHRIEYEAESYDWWVDPTNTTSEQVVIISADDYNLNARTLYDGQYSTVNDAVRIRIEAGATVGSTS